MEIAKRWNILIEGSPGSGRRPGDARRNWLKLVCAALSVVGLLSTQAVGVMLAGGAGAWGGGPRSAWLIALVPLSQYALLVPAMALVTRWGRYGVLRAGIAVLLPATVACMLIGLVVPPLVALLAVGVGGALVLAGAVEAVLALGAGGRRWRLAAVGGYALGLLAGWLRVFVMGHWRSGFALYVLIVVVLVGAAFKLSPPPEDLARLRPAVGPTVLFAGGIAALGVAVVERTAHGWTPLAIAANVLAVALLAACGILRIRAGQRRVPVGTVIAVSLVAVAAVILTGAALEVLQEAPVIGTSWTLALLMGAYVGLPFVALDAARQIRGRINDGWYDDVRF